MSTQKIVRVEQVGATESHVSSVEIEYDKVLAVVDGEEVEAGLLLKLSSSRGEGRGEAQARLENAGMNF